jgi:hypothetical protein
MPTPRKKIGPKTIHMLDQKDQHISRGCYKSFRAAISKMVISSIDSGERRALLDSDTGSLVCEYRTKLTIHMPRKFQHMMCESQKKRK